jgi:hypothetical protein
LSHDRSPATLIRRIPALCRWLGWVVREGYDLAVPPRYPRPGATGLAAFERRESSQHGEDGIVAMLLERIGASARFAVEFGCGNGTEANCLALLRRPGWSGLLIEADAQLAAAARERFAATPSVQVTTAAVTAENIGELFRNAGVPTSFDVLSIDTDGNDYWLWSALSAYRPSIVVIEYNSAYLPPARWVMPYDPTHVWDGTTYYGASLAALAELGDRLGYNLIGTDSSGVNAFFVLRSLREKAGFPALTALEAYRPLHLPGMFGKNHRLRLGPSGIES